MLNCFTVTRIYNYNKKVSTGEIIPKKIDRSIFINSVITIQRMWRRYAARKILKKRIARLEEVLGMTISSWQDHEILAKDEENFKCRRALMPVFNAQTEKTINDERSRVIFLNKISRI